MIEHFCWEFFFHPFFGNFLHFSHIRSVENSEFKTRIELSAMAYYPVLELVQLLCRFAMPFVLVTEDWLQTALNFSNALISTSTSNWICRNHQLTATSVTSAFAVYSTMFFVFVVHFYVCKRSVLCHPQRSKLMTLQCDKQIGTLPSEQWSPN